jgi:hypothetical protein
MLSPLDFFYSLSTTGTRLLWRPFEGANRRLGLAVRGGLW